MLINILTYKTHFWRIVFLLSPVPGTYSCIIITFIRKTILVHKFKEGVIILTKEKKKPNEITTHQIVPGVNSPFVSEVQTFNKPEDYEDAFEKYYPDKKDTNDSSKEQNPMCKPPSAL